MTVTIVHELPDRLRLSLPRLRRDRQSAAALEAAIAGLEGVRSARASPLTGSVLVSHDGLASTRRHIIRAIENPDAASPVRWRPRQPQEAVDPLVLVIALKLFEVLLGAAID